MVESILLLNTTLVIANVSVLAINSMMIMKEIRKGVKS